MKDSDWIECSGPSSRPYWLPVGALTGNSSPERIFGPSLCLDQIDKKRCALQLNENVF